MFALFQADFASGSFAVLKVEKSGARGHTSRNSRGVEGGWGGRAAVRKRCRRGHDGVEAGMDVSLDCYAWGCREKLALHRVPIFCHFCRFCRRCCRWCWVIGCQGDGSCKEETGGSAGAQLGAAADLREKQVACLALRTTLFVLQGFSCNLHSEVPRVAPYVCSVRSIRSIVLALAAAICRLFFFFFRSLTCLHARAFLQIFPRQ